MHFHHLDPASKIGSIADLLRNRGMKVIQEEISKCVLLCANCHIMRHVQERAMLKQAAVD
jgi:hypothetical protein